MPPGHDPRFPYRTELELPVVGLESEFKVFVDDVEVTPEEYWRTPSAFVDRPLLKRTGRSLQLPTGGALYFDGGVIEVVTPVIEIAPQCTARVVRSLWEQIGFVRDQLDRWEERHGVRVRLQAFSCHFNISFELGRKERGPNRTVQKLAVLLSHLLPVPVIVAGGNRGSTSFGVRPRRERIELTFDFIPDPGLMAATTALVVGVVRDVIGWPSYLVRDAEERGIPLLAGVEPGKHPTRKGWVTKDHHFPSNPFASNIDAHDWSTRDGRTMSLREIASAVVAEFRDSIRNVSDAFSFRLLESVMRGDTPALLDLDDRPDAYDDVGRTTRWGSVLPDLENFAALMSDAGHAESPRRRSADVDEKLAPPWRGELHNRRSTQSGGGLRKGERRQTLHSPSPRLTRSAYEKVFLKLGNGKSVRVSGEELVPVAVKGWYHALFRAPNGEERLISIDQLLDYLSSWEK